MGRTVTSHAGAAATGGGTNHPSTPTLTQLGHGLGHLLLGLGPVVALATGLGCKQTRERQRALVGGWPVQANRRTTECALRPQAQPIGAFNRDLVLLGENWRPERAE